MAEQQILRIPPFLGAKTPWGLGYLNQTSPDIPKNHWHQLSELHGAKPSTLLFPVAAQLMPNPPQSRIFSLCLHVKKGAKKK